MDPLAAKYTAWSTYTYGLDNPLLFVDPNGRDNMIYLIALGSYSGLKPERIAEQANAMFHTLGLDVKVQIWEGSITDFDPRFLDPTDNFAVLGSNPTTVTDYISSKGRKYSNSAPLYDYKHTYENPRLSINPEVSVHDVIALAANFAEYTADQFNAETIEQAIAFLIVHGYGHNMTGITHGTSGKDKGFMLPGQLLGGTYQSLYDAISDVENNQEILNLIKAKTGNPATYGPNLDGTAGSPACQRAPVDNYDANKSRSESLLGGTPASSGSN